MADTNELDEIISEARKHPELFEKFVALIEEAERLESESPDYPVEGEAE